MSAKIAAPITIPLPSKAWLPAQESWRRRRRRVRAAAILCWALTVIGLGWLLASAILGLSAPV